MNIETLKGIIDSPATTESDRQAAREALRALEAIDGTNDELPAKTV